MTACEKEIVLLRFELLKFIRAAQYVGQHRYGKNDPVGTRIVAVEDLTDLIPHALKLLENK